MNNITTMFRQTRDKACTKLVSYNCSVASLRFNVLIIFSKTFMMKRSLRLLARPSIQLFKSSNTIAHLLWRHINNNTNRTSYLNYKVIYKWALYKVQWSLLLLIFKKRDKKVILTIHLNHLSWIKLSAKIVLHNLTMK